MSDTQTAVAAAMAAAVVRAMSSTEWPNTRDRLAATLGAGNQELTEQTRQTLDDEQASLETGSATAAIVESRWQGRFEATMQSRSGLADELIGHLEDIRSRVAPTTSPAAPATPSDPTSTSSATRHNDESSLAEVPADARRSKRAVAILLAGLLVLLLVIIVGNALRPRPNSPTPALPVGPSQTGQDELATTPHGTGVTTEPSDERAVLSLLRQSLSTDGADAGYQILIVELAVRADRGVVGVDFPSIDGQVMITEGRSYPTELSFHEDRGDGPGNTDPTRAFSSLDLFQYFAVTPAATLCGISYGFNGFTTVAASLQAIAQIPLGTTPKTLFIQGFDQVALGGSGSRSGCAPNPSTMSPVGTELTFAIDGTPAASVKALSVVQGIPMKLFGTSQRPVTLIAAQIQNLDKYDKLQAGFRMWGIDDDGVARAGFAQRFSDSPGVCDTGVPTPSEVGPQQTVVVEGCFPYRPGHAIVAVALSMPTQSTSVQNPSLQLVAAPTNS